MKLIAIAMLMIVLMGCAPAEPTESGQYENIVFLVDRVVDEKAGVVCWVYRTYGIDCMPLSETKLER
jgi:hypothetical protein